MIDWEKLIKEHDEWESYNFPSAGIEDAILGIIEECGELCHAHLKNMQGIRGDRDAHELEARDAIADITIYLLGVMSHCNARPTVQPSLNPPTELWCLKHLAHEIGMIALNPSIYGCERVVHLLKVYCDFQGWSYEGTVTHTWREVKRRDWVKYPDTGLGSST